MHYLQSIVHHSAFGFYFIIINILSGIIFAKDKRAAKKGQHRIPERTLHLMEFFGGVFANVLLIYVLHHKNKKLSYNLWTWLVLIVWIILIKIIITSI